MLPSTERTVLDWLRTFDEADHPFTYVGQDAVVIGFVSHDPRLPEDQFLVSRYVLNCCVADVSALELIVEWPGSVSLAPNGWVRISGPVLVADLDGRLLPLVVAQTLEVLPEPDLPYLYN
jgi:uncharacterized repeat protein (TIGR03943 family)